MIQWIADHALLSLGCLSVCILLFSLFLVRSIEKYIEYERTKMIEDILKIVNGQPEAKGWHPHLTYRLNKLISDEFEKRLEYMRTKRKRSTY